MIIGRGKLKIMEIIRVKLIYLSHTNFLLIDILVSGGKKGLPMWFRGPPRIHTLFFSLPLWIMISGLISILNERKSRIFMIWRGRVMIDHIIKMISVGVLQIIRWEDQRWNEGIPLDSYVPRLWILLELKRKSYPDLPTIHHEGERRIQASPKEMWCWCSAWFSWLILFWGTRDLGFSTHDYDDMILFWSMKRGRNTCIRDEDDFTSLLPEKRCYWILVSLTLLLIHCLRHHFIYWQVVEWQMRVIMKKKKKKKK